MRASYLNVRQQWTRNQRSWWSAGINWDSRFSIRLQWCFEAECQKTNLGDTEIKTEGTKKLEEPRWTKEKINRKKMEVGLSGNE